MDYPGTNRSCVIAVTMLVPCISPLRHNVEARMTKLIKQCERCKHWYLLEVDTGGHASCFVARKFFDADGGEGTCVYFEQA